MCLYVLHRWHIALVVWRAPLRRVGTRQKRGKICHFTLEGNPSRAAIVPHNRQEIVGHIILTHWALWHGQFYCCPGWKRPLSQVTLSSHRPRRCLFCLCFTLSVLVWEFVSARSQGLCHHGDNVIILFFTRWKPVSLQQQTLLYCDNLLLKSLKSLIVSFIRIWEIDVSNTD